MSIITKFIIIFAIIFSSISIGIFYFIIGYSENSLKNQVFDDLIVLAETEEGYVLTFFEQIKGRVIDFSSDGLIRSYTDQILSGEKQEDIVSRFNAHLRNNKQSVDQTIMGILIVDLNGNVIASTDEREVGKNEADDEYFKNISDAKLNYGMAHISDVSMNYHFQTETPVVIVAAPIFSVDKGIRLGYIINQISLVEVNKVLSGMKQLELGAPSGQRGRRPSLDIYLVNKENLLITPSIYSNSGLLKQKMESPLIEACREGKEGAEIYKNHFGVEVLSASMCLPIHGWTLLTEVSEKEAFLITDNLKKEIVIFGIIFLVALIVASALFIYFSIIRSILSLKEGIRIIRGGNLDHRIEINTKDEFNDLAGNFNLMTGQVKELIDNVKASAMKIKESEEKYRIMFDGAVDGIFIADFGGNFIEVNRNTEIMTGYGSDELLKMNHLQIYSKDDVSRCQEQFRAAIQKNFCFIENVKILRKNGEALPADIGISQLAFGGKKYLQFIVRDVSERARIEKHHQEVDHLKSQFINVVSHQLRTPLNSIRWNLEILLGGDLGLLKKEQEKFLKTMYLNNQNIINIIADLFLALEIEESPIGIEKEIVDVKTILNDVIEGLKSNINIKNINLSLIEDEKDKKIFINVDKNKVTQVFSRLLDNAIKYTRENGTISIDMKVDNDNAVISISDNGIGIPSEEKKLLFSKFFRASNASLMHPNASGLGLFISRKIIEANNGKIWFESEEGKGTRFYISLPMAKS